MNNLLRLAWHSFKLGWMFLLCVPHFWRHARRQHRLEAMKETERLDRLRNPWKYTLAMEND